MKIRDMSKEDFLKIPLRQSWDIEVSGFNSMVIIPTGEMHDSGYMCMDFVAVNDDNEPICRLSCCSDVIHINGIGGYGEWIGRLPITFPRIEWRIDCLPCGLLRIFSDPNSLKAGHALSNFELFHIDTKQTKED